MTDILTEPQQTYRERLYRHYLADLRGTDLHDLGATLSGTAPYLGKLIREHLPRDKSIRILDLGCGYGALLYWLKKAGYRCLEGVDRSPEQVEGAHSLGLDFVKQDDIMGHLIQRQSASCDVVFAFDVLEHFAKEEALRFADEVSRVLDHGGLFILHLPNGGGIFGGSVIHGDFTHELTLTSRSLGQILRCAGFSEVRTFEDRPIVRGLLSTARHVIWMLARTFWRIAYAAETGDLWGDLILSQNFLAVARR